MEGVTCRLLPYGEAAGPENMADDEVLLEAAVAGVASLRFYGWSEATLSLGYFQPHHLRQTDPRLAGLSYVRRPSGGASLVHHHEVTYALALPAGLPWQAPPARSSAWLGRVHAIIATALAALGVPAQSVAGAAAGPSGGVLCFQDLTPGDLVLRGAKIVGSAQRRQRGALLQHGAVLLAASPYAPVLPGIAELTGKRLDAAAVAEAIARQWSRETGWALTPADWTAAERRRTAALAQTKYAAPAWNHKR